MSTPVHYALFRKFLEPGRRGIMSDTFDVLNPATEDIIRKVHMASAEEIDAVVAKAQVAWPAWRDLAPGSRADVLRKFAQLVTENNEELARLEVLEAGHTIGNSRWEAQNVANVLNYMAGGVERLLGYQIPVAGGVDITFH